MLRFCVFVPLLDDSENQTAHTDGRLGAAQTQALPGRAGEAVVGGPVRGGGSGRWPRAGPAPTLWAQRSPCPLCVPQGRPCRLLHSLSPWAGPVPQPQAGRGRGPWPWPPRLRRPPHSHGLPRPPQPSCAAPGPPPIPWRSSRQAPSLTSDASLSVGGSGALPPHSSRPPPLRVGRRACRCCPCWPACSWSCAFPPPCWPPRPAMPRECLLTQLLGGSGYLCAAGAQAVPSTRQVQGQGRASAMKGVAAHCW